MVGHVVLAHAAGRLRVEEEGLFVVPDAVVEAPYLEGYVFVRVQQVVVLPHSRHASAQVVAQLLPARGRVGEYGISELEEHIRVPVSQFQHGHYSPQGGVGQVLFEALLHHEEVIRPELIHPISKGHLQVGELRSPRLVQGRQAVAHVGCVAVGYTGGVERVLWAEHEGGALEGRLLLRVVQREAPLVGEPRPHCVVVHHEAEGAMHGDVRVHQACKLLRVVVPLIPGNDQRPPPREEAEPSQSAQCADR
mmetsp:Transcript_10901/g.24163  ORF Transcript_10901/g.24163 Transcript_10901/m.24163 type:complete len:250 (-) Transcript_10901:963-1712(-)